jgi:hypothetical protein
MEYSLVNATCRGQCPTAKGYYIGLKRLVDGNDQLESKWIWSNNVTWIQNQTNVTNNFSPSLTRFFFIILV